ncbi:MAG TPA: cell division protein FtsZ [Flavobacteriales bacterium]|jgi:cell division protein FtsZ|nr:cell division protein FtsZ [Flavobacteriales bacterium]HOZ40094.1 cell division protein FtsZ [Flavobacteriales bacterium]
MKFDIPQELSSIIKVIGVGGGGSNAVNHMYEQGIRGVDFIVCNTDRQALDVSPVPVKLQLGVGLTEGLGAGAVPERGKDAVQENLDEIRQLLSTRTKMVFITAGMGGGTGTGAAPVIAQVAREMGILTVGIVTSPFQWEGRRRKQQAVSGIEELRNAVDTLLVINNDRLRDLFGNLSLDNAFEHADNVLTTAARGIAEIITKTGKVNVDFEDVKTVMSRSGAAIMGMAEAEGEDRSLRAAQEALDSPLLNDNNIRGAKFVLLNITHGSRDILMDEIGEITDHIQEAAGSGADVIWGYGRDESLGDRVRITIIATGFETNPQTGEVVRPTEERKVIPLDADRPTMITQPIVNPVSVNAPVTSVAPPVPSAFEEPYLKPAEAVQIPEPTIAVAPQRTIEFEVEQSIQRQGEQAPVIPTQPEKVVFDLYDGAPGATASSSEVTEARLSPHQHQARVEERIAKVREMTQRLRSPSGLADLEREPAYKRKNIQITDAQHSADSTVSRYTLNEEVDEQGQRRVELKRNNPFLHDNVD